MSLSLRFAISVMYVMVYLSGTVAVCRAEDQNLNRPGLMPYTPTKIEWLALTVNSIVQHRASLDYPYALDIVRADHETLLIHVRYHPTVNRETMNHDIDTAREVIMITAKSYGWEKWVKIREQVEIYPSLKK
jgi:hypothetical protein